MKKLLTEEKVLKELGINDFRHITKDKVMVMASMIEKMDPIVAEKVLEQFPAFSTTMKDIVKDFNDNINRCLEHNSESVKSYYKTCDSIIESCKKLLDKEDLSFDEKKYILSCMLEVTNMKGRKDSEDKKFKMNMCVVSVSVIGITAMTLLTALGGNAKIGPEKG